MQAVPFKTTSWGEMGVSKDAYEALKRESPRFAIAVEIAKTRGTRVELTSVAY